MRILKATTKTQGQKPTDFFWTEDGEILKRGFVCCDSVGCGCDRSLVGVVTHKATTTFLVDDAPVTEEELRAILADSYVSAGFGEADDLVEESLATHRMAEVLPLGAVCDFVDHILAVRQQAA